MKRSHKTVIVAVVIFAAWSIGRLQAQGEAGNVVFVSANHAKFSDLPDGKGQVSMAPFGATQTPAHTRHLLNLCRDTTRACTPTRTMSGLL